MQEVPASPCPHPAWAGGRAWGALGWAQSKGLLFLLTCRTDWLLTDRLLLRVLGRTGGQPGLKTLRPSPRGGPVAGRGERPEQGLLGAGRGHRRWGATHPTQVAWGPEGGDGSPSQAAGVSEPGGLRTGPHPGGKSPDLGGRQPPLWQGAGVGGGPSPAPLAAGIGTGRYPSCAGATEGAALRCIRRAGESSGTQARCPVGSHSKPLAGDRRRARPQGAEPSRAGCCQPPPSPLPTSSWGSRFAEWVPTWHSSFRKRTPGSRPPPQQQPGLAAESGSALRAESWGPYPYGSAQAARAPCIPDTAGASPCALHIGPALVREGGAGSSAEVAVPWQLSHTLCTCCRARPAPLRPPTPPRPVFAWALGAGDASVEGSRGPSTPAAGGAADRDQAENPAPPPPAVTLGASRGSGLGCEGGPTPLTAQRRGPSPAPPPGHSPHLALPAVPLVPSDADVIPRLRPLSWLEPPVPTRLPGNPGWRGRPERVCTEDGLGSQSGLLALERTQDRSTRQVGQEESTERLASA